jgi:hypothetical protein
MPAQRFDIMAHSSISRPGVGALAAHRNRPVHRPRHRQTLPDRAQGKVHLRFVFTGITSVESSVPHNATNGKLRGEETEQVMDQQLARPVRGRGRHGGGRKAKHRICSAARRPTTDLAATVPRAACFKMRTWLCCYAMSIQVCRPAWVMKQTTLQHRRMWPNQNSAAESRRPH